MSFGGEDAVRCAVLLRAPRAKGLLLGKGFRCEQHPSHIFYLIPNIHLKRLSDGRLTR